MRKVSLGMNFSLDGFVARADGALDWMFPNIDAERKESILAGLAGIETFLMGRVAYEGMAAHLPTADDPIAPLMNNAEKVVFSTTLESVDWQQTRREQVASDGAWRGQRREFGGPAITGKNHETR